MQNAEAAAVAAVNDGQTLQQPAGCEAHLLYISGSASGYAATTAEISLAAALGYFFWGGEEGGEGEDEGARPVGGEREGKGVGESGTQPCHAFLSLILTSNNQQGGGTHP